ncbi:hypothetical protein ACM16X_06870 [Haloarcula japonica]|uniref:hypothetical protein n=1 Tax=Haloarcula japonica TaxID=29282 RepID=UPI0039F662E6
MSVRLEKAANRSETVVVYNQKGPAGSALAGGSAARQDEGPPPPRDPQLAIVRESEDLAGNRTLRGR